MANKNYINGKGSLALMRRDANGNYSKIIWIGNCPMFKMGFKKDRIEHYESESGANVKDLSITKTIDGEGQFTIEELSKENAAIIFGGTVVSIAGATITDEPLANSTTGLAVGDAFKLANSKLTSFTQLEDSGGVVSNTKYTVDLVRGVVRLTDLTGVTGPLTATYVTTTHNVVRMADDFDAEFAVVFMGINKANLNKKVNVEVYRITIDPPTDADWITDDIAKYEIKFMALRDEVKAADANYGSFARVDYVDDVDKINRTTTV